MDMKEDLKFINLLSSEICELTSNKESIDSEKCIMLAKRIQDMKDTLDYMAYWSFSPEVYKECCARFRTGFYADTIAEDKKSSH